MCVHTCVSKYVNLVFIPDSAVKVFPTPGGPARRRISPFPDSPESDMSAVCYGLGR